MKVTIQKLSTQQASEPESALLKIKEMNDRIRRAIELLEASGAPNEILVQLDDQNLKVLVSDIFYVESVDFKTFIYTESTIYQSKLRLYEVEDLLKESDFLRVNRQIILNVNKIYSVSSAGGGRIEAILDNGEKVIVSRQYAPLLKVRFGL